MDNIPALIHTPHEVGLAGYSAAKRAKEYKDVGIPLNIPGTDISDYFAPLLPWEICAVQAQTHNGKTLFQDWWERQVAESLKDGDVVHISTEESIEAMAFFEYGRLLDIMPAKLARGEFSDVAQLQIAMQKIDKSRIWRIAESSERVNVFDDGKIPDLTLSNIYRVLKAMQDGKIAEATKIRLIVLDYLQALPIDTEIKQSAPDAQRRLQVRNDVYRLRKMTVALSCPIIVGVQAKQKLEGANPPYMIPGTYDGEETAAIAQRFDRIISLWLPKTTHPIGSSIARDGEHLFTVEENRCFLKVNKQRGGLPSSRMFDLKVDYGRREFMSYYGKPVAERRDFDV